MRFLISFLLLMVYLPGTFFVVGNVHFCQDELTDLSIYESNATCFCGEMQDSKTCCNTETVVITNSDEQLKTGFQFSPLSLFSVILPSIYLDLQTQPELLTGSILPVSHPPERENALPIFLQLNNLRI